MSNFHPLEVVGRGSEAQLQVGENINTMTRCEKDLFRCGMGTYTTSHSLDKCYIEK